MTRTKTKPKLITLVVPVLNEQESVAPFLAEINKVFAPLAPKTTCEILFVNDGSTDATETAIGELMKRDKRVGLINLSRNFGKEAAMRAGFEYAKGDAVIPIDVDLQDPPEIIPEMIEKWQAGAKVVNARRSDRSNDSWVKRITAAGFYKLINMLSEIPMPQNVSDYRLLDRVVIDIICGLGERVRFNRSLVVWTGFDAQEVTIERGVRKTGQTAWSYWRLWNYALDGIFASSTVPLRIWTYIGTIFWLLSVFYAAYIFFYTLFTGADTPGYASTVILILLFGGMNMLAIGIIGEYVGRIYTEVRQRPIFLVRSTHGLGEGS